MSGTDLTLAEGLALSAVMDARDGVLRAQHRVRLGRSWSTWAMPCLICGTPTHSRDGKGLPIDAGCAEQALSSQLLQLVPEWRDAR